MKPFSAALSAVGMLALALSLTSPVLAQTAGAPSGDSVTLDEVVVTAQKREENLQKAALSVASVDGDAVRAQGRTDLPNMLRGVSGLEVGNGFFFIRGIGNAPVFGQDASVTVSANGVFLQPVMKLSDAFYDVQRVEVARGPQSTLTGRSSEGGAINVITNEPSLEKVEIKGLVEAGDHAKLNTQGVINVPLTQTLAFRASAATVKRNGFLNGGGGAITSTAARARVLFEPSDDIKLVVSGDYNIGNTAAAGSGATASVTGRIDLAQPFTTVSGYYYNPTPPISVSKYDVTNVYADFTWKTRIGTVYFQPTYQENDFVLYPGFTTNPVNLFTNLALGYNYDAALARSTTSSSQENPSHTSTFELRLSNPENSKLTWLAGAYYYRTTQSNAMLAGTSGTSIPNNATANAANATAVGYLPTIDPSVIYPESGERISVDKDVYFQATYPILPSWRVTAGARYSSDSKERNSSPGGFLEPNGQVINTNFRFPLDDNTARPGVTNGTTNTNGPFVYYNVSASTASYSHVNWLAKLEHDFTDDAMGYAMVSTGWKTGSFVSIPTGDALCPTTPLPGVSGAIACRNAVTLVTPGFRSYYDPEYLTSYEVGSKNTFVDGRLRLNGSLYYYDYKGFQFNYSVNWVNPATGVDPDFTPGTGQTGNARSAVSYGGELESSFLITQHDKADLNVSYIHARLGSLEISSLATPSVQAWANALKGFAFSHSPTWQVKPRYSHVFDFAGGGNLTASVDAQISSRQFINLPANCQQIPGSYAAGTCTTAALTVDEHVLTYNVQPGFTKLNASLAYHSQSNRWGVTGYVNNATNKTTISQIGNPASFVGFASVSFTPDDPRTYGIIVNASL